MAHADEQTGKLARWSLLLQEYDMIVAHKRGSLNTNADCLSRYPQPITGKEPILPDWTKGDYNLTPVAVFAFMATEPTEEPQALQADIWEDLPVIHFLKTHQYRKDLTPLDKDRLYRRAKEFRWLAHNLYKLRWIPHAPHSLARRTTGTGREDPPRYGSFWNSPIAGSTPKELLVERHGQHRKTCHSNVCSLRQDKGRLSIA